MPVGVSVAGANVGSSSGRSREMLPGSDALVEVSAYSECAHQLCSLPTVHVQRCLQRSYLHAALCRFGRIRRQPLDCLVVRDPNIHSASPLGCHVKQPLVCLQGVDQLVGRALDIGIAQTQLDDGCR